MAYLAMATEGREDSLREHGIKGTMQGDYWLTVHLQSHLSSLISIEQGWPCGELRFEERVGLRG